MADPWPALHSLWRNYESNLIYNNIRRYVKYPCTTTKIQLGITVNFTSLKLLNKRKKYSDGGICTNLIYETLWNRNVYLRLYLKWLFKFRKISYTWLRQRPVDRYDIICFSYGHLYFNAHFTFLSELGISGFFFTVNQQHCWFWRYVDKRHTWGTYPQFL